MLDVKAKVGNAAAPLVKADANVDLSGKGPLVKADAAVPNLLGIKLDVGGDKKGSLLGL